MTTARSWRAATPSRSCAGSPTISGVGVAPPPRSASGDAGSLEHAEVPDPRNVEQRRVDRLTRAILWSRSPIRRDSEVTMCADMIYGEEQHDVVIIGAGTAGTSCALECFDIQLDTVVLETDERPGGQLVEIDHSVRNVATGSFRDGSALRDSLEESAAILGDRLRLSHSVTRADLGERRIHVDGERIRGRAFVIATGTLAQQLPAAEDGAFGGDVTYHLEARPGRFVGRDVVVIGGGDSATLDALELAREGSRVSLVHRSEALTARHDIVEQVRHEPRIEDLSGWELDAMDGGDQLEAVTIVRRADGRRRRLAARGLVVKIARVPRTDLFRDQVGLDRAGAIVVDAEMRTSREGVFAAGDVVAGSYARVASALGQGSLAARSVLRYLQGPM
jgi:thioredoxin reductase (NADPH)